MNKKFNKKLVITKQQSEKKEETFEEFDEKHQVKTNRNLK